MTALGGFAQPSCDYNNRILQGNWFEDRFLEAEGTAVDPVLRPYSGPEEPLVGATKGRLSYLSNVVTAPHHDRYVKPNTRRCIPNHAAPGEVYSPITQKQADSAHIHERLAARKTPLMVTSANFALAGNTGLSSTKTWGLGSTALTKADYTAHEGRWETTNQHFYVDLPADKRLKQPSLYNGPLDKSRFIRAGLTKQCFDGSMADETPGGRAGARGALSRHAAEPGSLYGTSVFWDEYAAGKVGPAASPGGIFC